MGSHKVNSVSRRIARTPWATSAQESRARWAAVRRQRRDPHASRQAARPVHQRPEAGDTRGRGIGYAGQADQSPGVPAAQPGVPAHPADVELAGVRYAMAGDLREKGFAVIHTCGRKGEANGHVSVVWPDTSPLDEADPAWPAPVQEAFASCFTEQEG